MVETGSRFQFLAPWSEGSGRQILEVKASVTAVNNVSPRQPIVWRAEAGLGPPHSKH